MGSERLRRWHWRYSNRLVRVLGTLGMLLNFAVTLGVSRFTPPPPAVVQASVEGLRTPG